SSRASPWPLASPGCSSIPAHSLSPSASPARSSWRSRSYTRSPSCPPCSRSWDRVSARGAYPWWVGRAAGVSGTTSRRRSCAAPEDLRTRIAALPNVSRVEMPLTPAVSGEHVTFARVFTPRTAQSDDARNLVRAIRQQSLAGGEVLVTGSTAFDVDGIQYLLDRTPIAIGFVMLTTILALFLLLGSVV